MVYLQNPLCNALHRFCEREKNERIRAQASPCPLLGTAVAAATTLAPRVGWLKCTLKFQTSGQSAATTWLTTTSSGQSWPPRLSSRASSGFLSGNLQGLAVGRPFDLLRGFVWPAVLVASGQLQYKAMRVMGAADSSLPCLRRRAVSIPVRVISIPFRFNWNQDSEAARCPTNLPIAGLADEDKRRVEFALRKAVRKEEVGRAAACNYRTRLIIAPVR